MRTISKRQRQSEKEERSTFLCKEVDPDYLGREIYADNVDTPYSFYLVRKLNLARDYQNLAEGEAFFDAICDSWDETEDFEELVVKKIYMYVETETMYYTLYVGSFEPTRRDLRLSLKKWLEEIVLEKKDHSLVHKGEVALNSGEIQGMMKQMLETSNEIFRLRKIITDLTDTINHGKLDMTSSKSTPIISRSIQTIHLKRAQPLVIEDENTEIDNDQQSDQEEASIDVEVDTEPVDAPISEEIETAAIEEPMKAAGIEIEKKLEQELVEKPIQEDSPVEEITTYPEQETENNLEPEPKQETTVKTSRASKKLKRKQAEKAGKSAEMMKEKKKAVPTQPKTVVLPSLVLKKRKTPKATPSNWPRFSKLMKSSKTIAAPPRIPEFSKSERENLEDEIYLRFMNKRMRAATKKNHNQKKSILRSELLTQIGQAEYLNYSWGQVLRQRKEDVLICGRLSCGGLVASLDEFLQEMRELAYSRSLFGRKVRCSVDALRRLEGYILMDQYMQKLSLMPIEK
ncbi:hypothetical protein [Candidatus Enterococcus mansonii]|uniref:Uncharacterized protein n=1 Tax=Candidatus Enterococcus mansonii TaxID=1834181 RepID=A0A242C5V3_9ENTE|nr:hypothetical protein [Enterococcus sp. 4G2_DIV0659]OTO05488.1 hypothetical protein A5880_002661 [Enterococcus sp. 4G2_DIV0659]